MKAYVLYGKEDLRYEDMPTPEIKSGHVLIKTRRVGICGTDVHYYMDGKAGASIPKRPFIFGHEVVGEIADIGEGVKDFKVGTRVAIDPSQPCWKCEYCRTGRYNLCRTTAFLGSAKFDPPTHGTYCEYFTMPVENCYSLPDHLDDGQAAMLEPLSVATHAVMRAGNIAGKSVLISGGGPIGQMVLLAARAFGADIIALTDIAEYPRSFAMILGADTVLNPIAGNLKEDIFKITKKGFDVVFEASGAPSAVKQAMDAVGYGGTIVQIGTLPTNIELPFNMVMEKELKILGSFRFAHVFQLALKQMANGRVNLTSFISKVFPFEKLPDAINAAYKKDNIMKIQVKF